MKRKVFSSFIFVAVTLVSLCGLSFGQTDGGHEVFELVNRERSRMQRSGLEWDERLASVARSYSRQLARERFFDHFDRSGKTVVDRMNAAHVRSCSGIGENLFYCDDHDYFTTTAVLGWMTSPSHRTNMLDRKWTATGIGIATDHDGRIFVTQVFTRE